jgi:hypothetical protein
MGGILIFCPRQSHSSVIATYKEPSHDQIPPNRRHVVLSILVVNFPPLIRSNANSLSSNPLAKSLFFSIFFFPPICPEGQYGTEQNTSSASVQHAGSIERVWRNEAQQGREISAPNPERNIEVRRLIYIFCRTSRTGARNTRTGQKRRRGRYK